MSIFKWEDGRQYNGGYKKLSILNFKFFDMYLLKFPEGSSVPKHRDPVPNKKHFRMNIILKHAKEGGIFHCSNYIINLPRLKLFRPDKYRHRVEEVKSGTRCVLSIGWVWIDN